LAPPHLTKLGRLRLSTATLNILSTCPI